ncbi:cytochrome P450 [Xylariaceae sp. FL0804]|nr:cytochrome P450 [Xylariaceae sp. FL0804]
MASSTSIEYALKGGLPSANTALTLLVTLAFVFLIRESYRSNFSKIKGIPEVPGALPFVGHLHLLGGRSGKNDATVFSEWSRRLGSPIVQCRLGDQRTVVVSDWAAIRDLWVGQSSGLVHRPPQPGFVDRLGVDLTGSPMTEQIRRCRAAGMRALGRAMWPRYYHLVEPSSARLVRDIRAKSKSGGGGGGKTGDEGTGTPVDTYAHLRHVVFDLCLSLTYGARFGDVDDAFMLRFIGSINAISAVRSSTRSYRHFVPLLRHLLTPWETTMTTSSVAAVERVRAAHVDALYGAHRARVARGERADCIVASLGADRLTPDEIHGTCISLLQAAPDTVASGVYMTLAWLATPRGRPTQRAAYDAILAAYDGDRDAAWRGAFREDRVPLITSLNKETLRFFVLAPYATPRRTSRPVECPGGAVLPEGVTVIMNAQEANHDAAHFGDDAWSYKPDRYLHNSGEPLPHLAFGAGARICPAVAISNRLICALLTRLILAFEIAEPAEGEGRRPNVDPIAFSDVVDQLVAHPRFYDAHFRTRDPGWLERITREELSGAKE